LGVNYYEVDYGGGHRKTVVRVYSDNTIYTYIDDNQDTFGLHLVDETEHYLKGVPINEFKNNEDRTGAYESVLDDIDAYDLSQSELANFQQNSNDAILLITGNPYTGSDDNDYLEDGSVNPNGRLGVALGFKKAQIAVLDDNPNPGGSQPDAKYLVKQYDSAGAEAYKQRLVNDILRFTFTPDILDNNFSGIQSGESMKYKLMASDNYRSKQERLFKKGLMRRLRLAVNIWEVKGNEATNYQAINQTAVIFSPNLPQNDTELANIAKSLFGVVSDQTVYELLEQVTGIDAEDELKRLKAEEPQEPEPRIGEVTADDQEEAQ
jgi:SPP1 family phage portal protein